MKITLTLLLFISTLSLKAQDIVAPDQLVIQQKSMTLEKIERPGFAIEITGDSKTIGKHFDDFTKDTYEWNLKSRGGEFSQEDIFDPKFSDKHFNVYAYIIETEFANEFRFFISFGTDIYVNPTDYPLESERAKALLKAFGKNYYNYFVNEEITDKSKIIASETKDLNSVKKKIGKSTKDVSKAQVKLSKLEKSRIKTEEKIRELEAEIEENKADTEALNKDISEEKTTIETLQSEEKTKQENLTKTSAELEVLKRKLDKIKNY